MLAVREKTGTQKYEKGFTLIELMIVIAVLAIIVAVFVPSFLETTKKAKKKVCSTNALKVEEKYELYLYEIGKEHTGTIFKQYVQEQAKDICPDSGLLIYKDGKIKCSLHSLDLDDGEEDVPYL